MLLLTQEATHRVTGLSPFDSHGVLAGTMTQVVLEHVPLAHGSAWPWEDNRNTDDPTIEIFVGGSLLSLCPDPRIF